MTAGHEYFDAVIVGAGPAGSSAAIRLAGAGRKVLLIDKAKFPRDKLCGEFVSPECLDHFRELGVSDRILALAPPRLSKTVFYSSKGRSLSIPNEWLAKNKSSSIGISRLALDNILLMEAVNARADVRVNTAVVDIKVANGEVCGLQLRGVDGKEFEIQSGIVIDATGRGRYLARRFDKTRHAKRAKQVAFKTHIRHANIDIGACELFRFEGGYGGTSEIEGGIYDLCFVVDSETVRNIGNDPAVIFERIFLANPRARQVLGDCEVVSGWISVPLANYGASDVSPFPGVLAIGDAAAFIDPFTGSGIALALESSRIACSAIVEGRDVEEIGRLYSRLHAANFKWRLRACSAIRTLSRSQILTELIIGTLGASKIARRMVARMTRASSLRRDDMKNA